MEGKYHRLGKDLGFTLAAFIFFSIFYTILSFTGKMPNYIPFEVVGLVASIIFFTQVLK
tara:strand:- start:8738 stop:8914 length:177 start_codon:yes stop_codon:yes gene_type:complete